MLIIPAIDLREGKVVRLRQGRFEQKTTYSNDPIDTARHWQRQGAKYLHIVDLDGAKTGRVCHLDLVKRIAKAVKIPFEFGGGLRNERSIRQVLNCGVDRIVLGTILQDLDFLHYVFRKFKQRIIVSIDARSDVVRLNGWKRQLKSTSILTQATRLKDIGFQQIIYTDIARDGMLKGPNIKMIKRILKDSKLSVIASGGVSSLADLFRLNALTKLGLVGVIVGKALYEAKFTLKEALKKYA